MNVGDFVRLIPREKPFHDAADAWWELIEVDETGISARLWSGANVIAVRRHVALTSITGWRERA